MRHLSLSEINDNRPTVLLLNGGGQPPYNKFDRVIKLFSQFDCNLVAIELPGHGKSPFADMVTVEEMLKSFKSEFKEICDNYENIGLFGFSLGGLLALKAMEYKLADFNFAIIVGAAIRIGKKEEQRMQYYTTEEFFEKMKWRDLLLNYHKQGWKELLHSVHDMLYIGSPIFSSPDNLPDQPIHLIIGDNDEVTSHEMHQTIAENYEQIHLHVLSETSHFEYFNAKWNRTRIMIKDILDEQIEE